MILYLQKRFSLRFYTLRHFLFLLYLVLNLLINKLLEPFHQYKKKVHIIYKHLQFQHHNHLPAYWQVNKLLFQFLLLLNEEKESSLFFLVYYAYLQFFYLFLNKQIDKPFPQIF